MFALSTRLESAYIVLDRESRVRRPRNMSAMLMAARTEVQAERGRAGLKRRTSRRPALPAALHRAGAKRVARPCPAALRRAGAKRVARPCPAALRRAGAGRGASPSRPSSSGCGSRASPSRSSSSGCEAGRRASPSRPSSSGCEARRRASPMPPFVERKGLSTPRPTRAGPRRPLRGPGPCRPPRCPPRRLPVVVAARAGGWPGVSAGLESADNVRRACRGEPDGAQSRSLAARLAARAHVRLAVATGRAAERPGGIRRWRGRRRRRSRTTGRRRRRRTRMAGPRA